MCVAVSADAGGRWRDAMRCVCRADGYFRDREAAGAICAGGRRTKA